MRVAPSFIRIYIYTNIHIYILYIDTFTMGYTNLKSSTLWSINAFQAPNLKLQNVESILGSDFFASQNAVWMRTWVHYHTFFNRSWKPWFAGCSLLASLAVEKQFSSHAPWDFSFSSACAAASFNLSIAPGRRFVLVKICASERCCFKDLLRRPNNTNKTLTNISTKRPNLKKIFI